MLVLVLLFSVLVFVAVLSSLELPAAERNRDDRAADLWRAGSGIFEPLNEFLVVGAMASNLIIGYKLATLTFKTISSDEPSCLRSLLITHQPARNLRSSTLNLLTVTIVLEPFYRTSMARNSLLCADVPLKNYSLTHSSRAFRHSATAIWNNLPADIGLRGANSLQCF